MGLNYLIERPSLGVRAGARSLLAMALGVSTHALAQEAPAPAPSNDAAPKATVAPGTADQDDIVVLGTARSDLTAFQSSSPVDVLSEKQLQQTQAPSVAEALSRVAPSINFLRYTGVGATAGVSSPQLRGLDPDEVLVLVNGKRRHAAAQIHAKVAYGRGSQAVDWNTIAFAGVRNVELLRDGASAQYGSDAIAGVVNILLREDRSGGNISTQFGNGYSNGGRTNLVEAWKGFALPNGGFLTVAANYSNIAGTGPEQYPDPRHQYYTGDPNASRETTVNRYQRQVTPDFYEWNILFNAALPVGGDWKIYAFGSYGDRLTDKTGVRRRPLDDQTVRAIYPDGFTPYQHANSQDDAFTAGISNDANGTPAIGTFGLSVNYGRNRVDYTIHDTDNPSLGAASPTQLYNGALINQETDANLEWVKDVRLIGTKPLTISAGAGYESQTYEIVAGEPDSYTQGGVPILDGPSAGKPAQGETVGYSPFYPENAGSWTRHVWAVHAGLEQSIGQLDLGVAGRYENYSDFGDTATGKASARFNFSRAFAVRGTVSTGFRAPALGQEHWSASTVTWSTTAPGTYFETRTISVDSPIARALGAPALKPERSTNLSAGLVFRPFKAASLTVDLYQIDIDDRITLTDNLKGKIIDTLVAAQGLPAGSAVSFFTNGVDTRTRGLDVVGKWSGRLGAGTLDVLLAANVNSTHITHFASNPTPLASAGLTLIGRESQGLIQRLSPDSKLTANLSYAISRWTLIGSAVRYGTYGRNSATNPNQDVFIGAQVVVDASISYELLRGLRLTAGAHNLFDSHPDTDTISLASALVSGGSSYPSFAPDGYTGGYYYGAISFRF